ncbi:MAG: diguanylate cyclase [Candidatus Omnitrophica bacterium]|nr:diguanylate cyclase [Candidatus Omnitrophota bacterium]MBU4590757.1 diguanylate cyclase [Candidatus Omnitrophota bacterium]
MSVDNRGGAVKITKQQKEIAELKQALLKANEDIEKLSKVKSDFVSIISHELRTPLTSIKESVSLVLDGIAGPINVEQKNFLSMAKNNIDRLVGIIANILDFSKLESGRVTMHKRKMDINEIIKDVYVLTRPIAEKNNLGFEMELSDNIEKTWFDPDRISQALKNLISNAIKFNKPNGSIKISSSDGRIDGKKVIKVIVEDAGIGIPKEDAPWLFKTLNPLDTSMTRRHAGIGLGLAVCKRIIGFHGGDIWVESKKDKGSQFIFALPVYDKDTEFNFLLDEAIERAKYNDMKLALIIFAIRNRKDATEEAISELEKNIHSVVRGPEDKVTRFKDGEFIVIMAGTDSSGAEKIIGRMKGKVRVSLNFGVAVYPDDAKDKEGLIKKAEKELKSKNNTL